MATKNYLDKIGLIRLWQKIKDALLQKVDKKDGWGLSEKNYSQAEQNKLAGIAEGATKNTLVNQNITLSTSWTTEGAYKVQTVSANVMANDTPVLDVVTSTADFAKETDEWSKIFKAVANAGDIKFYAKEATTKALTVSVKVVR